MNINQEYIGTLILIVMTIIITTFIIVKFIIGQSFDGLIKKMVITKGEYTSIIENLADDDDLSLIEIGIEQLLPFSVAEKINNLSNNFDMISTHTDVDVKVKSYTKSLFPILKDLNSKLEKYNSYMRL